MMKDAIYRAKAIEFLRQYSVEELSSSVLQDVLQKQGYRVVYINRIENRMAVDTLLREIGCEEFARNSKAFTYKNGPNQIVFIDGNLQETDMTHALAHEEGHIFCGHMERANCSLANVEDEWEANEFAHYIINRPFSIRARLFSQKHKKLLTILLCVLFILAIGALIAPGIQRGIKESQGYVKTMDYYVTETGAKYHTKECRYIIDAANIRKITEDEYNSGKYEACKECIDK